MRSFAFNTFFYLFTLAVVLIGVVLLPIPSPRPMRWLLQSWARGVMWGMRVVGGMHVELRGQEHVPAKGPWLLANKHQSESDGIVLAAEIPGVAFVAMQELFSYPLIGWILYRLGMIRVDTCGGGRERENLSTFARRAYETGRHIAIYPEGHLMAVGEKERYRSGIFYLYRDLGVPVTPVATCIGLLWNRRDWVKRPGRAAVEFLPPIMPGLDKGAFMRTMETTIEDATARLVAEFTGRPVEPARLVLHSPPPASGGATAQPVSEPR
jgi:1-acyl-sn-glycerol-3-phosphate acyltransferase